MLSIDIQNQIHKSDWSWSVSCFVDKLINIAGLSLYPVTRSNPVLMRI
jgi:hypothetical protein